MTEPTQITREQLALAHHSWHCRDLEHPICTPDDQDYDFADFALEQIGGAS